MKSVEVLTPEKCKVRLRVRVMVTERSAEGKVMVTGRSTGCEVSQGAHSREVQGQAEGQGHGH